MRSLYLRIWLTVVTAVALFGLISGWMVQQHLDRERLRFEGATQERLAAWADLLERSLPGPDAPKAEQAAALRDWSQRLRMPIALHDAAGQRTGASESFLRREADGLRATPVRLDDGRTLWVMRLLPRGGPAAMPGAMQRQPPPWLAWRMLPEGVGLALLLALLFVGVAAGAWPVVRRLTGRLEALQAGVEIFGKGQLGHRVAEEGRDEVAALAASFNRAAGRIQALLQSHQSLLANASHELRSPLARLKMALSLLDESDTPQRTALKREIETNIAELDARVDEVLLASRRDAPFDRGAWESVDLLGLAAEEAARTQALAHGEALTVRGDERLLRRALRNLLENARRYGGGEVEVQTRQQAGVAQLRVSDRGPGVPEAFRARIFEPFFRLPGHAEREGGVGLGLALVRQIAERHGGSVRCEPREGGGSTFVVSLPLAAA
jgi:signal transduction histidine kinase